MDTLLPELFELIRDSIIYVTDIRNLSRVNKKYNKSCEKRIIELEKLYRKKYIALDFTKYLNGRRVEKYTIEIILDKRYELIPENYYNQNNYIICSMLAFVGNLELLKYACSKLCPVSSYVSSCAIYNGHVDVLDWSRCNSEIPIDPGSAGVNLGTGGHTNVFEWLLENNAIICIGTIIYNATIKGHLHMLQFIQQHDLYKEKFYTYTTDSSQYAAQYGHIHILQWFYDNKYHLNDNYCLIAADSGQIKVLDWALKHHMFIEFTDYEIIVQNGHIEVLQWLIDNNFKLNTMICKLAVEYNQTDILKWAHEKGFK